MTLWKTLDSFTPRLKIIPLWSNIITPLEHDETLFFYEKKKVILIKIDAGISASMKLRFFSRCRRLFCNVNNNLHVNLGKLDEILRMENYWISDTLSYTWYIQQTPHKPVAAYRLHNSKLWKFDLSRYRALFRSNLSKANFDRCIA